MFKAIKKFFENVKDYFYTVKGCIQIGWEESKHEEH